MIRIGLVFIFLIFGLTIFGQDNSANTSGIYYTSEKSGGVFLHTLGVGANYRYTKRVTAYNRLIFTLEATNLKHYKEYPRYSATSERYIYGKKNGFITLRPAIGKQKVHFTKYTDKGVEISSIFMAGLSVGVLKPIYYVISGNPITQKPETLERLNLGVHNITNIEGKGPFLNGVEEIEFHGGFFTRFSFMFDYSNENERLKAIEVGVNLDVFYKPVPILEVEENNWLFPTLFVNFQFGRKYL